MKDFISNANIEGYMCSDALVFDILSFELQLIMRYSKAMIDDPVEEHFVVLKYFYSTANWR